LGKAGFKSFETSNNPAIVLNGLNDLNVWNIPERKACLRGETLLSLQLALIDNQTSSV